MQRTVSRDSKGSSSVTYRPVIEFNPRGSDEDIVFTASVGSNPPSHEVGDKVRVLYNPGKPRDARIRSFIYLWMMPLMFALFVLVFGGIGAGFLIAVLLHKRKIDWLRVNGMAIEAQIADIYINRSVKLFKRSPYKIALHYNDPSTGEQYRFVSENIFKNPQNYLDTHQLKELTVLIDRENPLRYHVDINPLLKG